jgi:hypothetical protein
MAYGPLKNQHSMAHETYIKKATFPRSRTNRLHLLQYMICCWRNAKAHVQALLPRFSMDFFCYEAYLFGVVHEGFAEGFAFIARANSIVLPKTCINRKVTCQRKLIINRRGNRAPNSVALIILGRVCVDSFVTHACWVVF